MRVARVWTGNLSKVLRMEWERLHVLGGVPPDVSRGCADPIRLYIQAGGLQPGEQRVTTTCVIRCRKCDICQSNRRRMWAARAYVELELARRSWFVTLTATPEKMSEWFRAADLIYAPGVGRTLSSGDYDKVVFQAYRDIQKWKKRVQRAVPGIRYLFTVERHTGKRSVTAWGKAGLGDHFGLPHFHAFVHETDAPITYNKLKKASRPIGFFNAKLVDPDDAKAVWYACKYLTKDNGSRNCWPSFRYGRPTVWQLENLLDDLDAELKLPSLIWEDDVPSTGEPEQGRITDHFLDPFSAPQAIRAPQSGEWH